MAGKPVREYVKTSYLENRISKIKYPTSVRREKRPVGKKRAGFPETDGRKERHLKKDFLTEKKQTKQKELSHATLGRDGREVKQERAQGGCLGTESRRKT